MLTSVTTGSYQSLTARNRTKSSRQDVQVVEKPVENQKHEVFGLYTKLGALATCALSIGLVLILASLAFLWFLWLANDANHVWRMVADRDWFPRAIALSSVVIRQSVSFQAAAATAMVASLALENFMILLLNLASVSMIRNTNGGPYMLFWWLWKAFVYNPSRWRTVLWPLTITILTITTILVQFTSFALLSDLDTVVVAASTSNQSQATHFQYDANGAIPVITHGSTWSQQLQSYVSFAEYHEAPAPNLPDGVLDTGLTMRAFLPVVDQQSRSMIATWNGLATVLDARTLCVRPIPIQPRIHYSDNSLALDVGFTLDLDDPDALGLKRMSYASHYNCSTGSCPEATACMIPLAPLGETASTEADQAVSSQWRMVICQPSDDEAQTLFTLQSQFQTPGTDTRQSNVGGDANYSFGNAYLVVNVSSGSEADWAQAIPSEDSNSGIFRGSGTPAVGYSVHGQNNEWYDLIFSEDGNLNLSISVCYTAFDTADLHVNIESSGNHSDVVPAWNAQKQTYEYGNVRAQFGQDINGESTYSDDFKARNIMSLKKRQSWIPEPDFGDYVVPENRVTQTSWITDYANMAGSLQSNVFHYDVGGNETRFLWHGYQLTGVWDAIMFYDYADASLTGLVQEILGTGGNLAFAMQSIVTSLSELAYYQQLQQLNGISTVTSSSYQLSSAPVRKRGILAVTIVLAIHVILVFCIVLPAFLLGTKISTLGNAWQVVAQSVDPETKPILDRASLATDGQAEREVKVPVVKKNKLKNHEVVGFHSFDNSVVNVVRNMDYNSPAELVEEQEMTRIFTHHSYPTLESNGATGNRHDRDELLREDSGD